VILTAPSDSLTRQMLAGSSAVDRESDPSATKRVSCQFVGPFLTFRPLARSRGAGRQLIELRTGCKRAVGNGRAGGSANQVIKC
jgi:hypothetical protein